MQYAMELLGRAHQADLLREAEQQRVNRGVSLRERRLANPSPRLPDHRRRNTR
jgi:hypothetical protein